MPICTDRKPAKNNKVVYSEYGMDYARSHSCVPGVQNQEPGSDEAGHYRRPQDQSQRPGQSTHRSSSSCGPPLAPRLPHHHRLFHFQVSI